MFSSLDAQPVLSRPMKHPQTGQSPRPTTSSESHCPTFRHQRPRTPRARSYSHCPPSPRYTTVPSRSRSPVPPIPPMPPSPHLPLKTSYSTPAISSLTNTASPAPIYAPSRSSSTRSNYTFTSTTTAATAASRSSSTTSRRSTMKPRPGPLPLPPQAGHNNSLAELHARQANITSVQQPISPYADDRNPLERMGHVVSGIVRRKSSMVTMRATNRDEWTLGTGGGLKKKGSFARLGWGGRGAGEYEAERRGSAPGAVDVSRNF